MCDIDFFILKSSMNSTRNEYGYFNVGRSTVSKINYKIDNASTSKILKINIYFTVYYSSDSN